MSKRHPLTGRRKTAIHKRRISEGRRRYELKVALALLAAELEAIAAHLETLASLAEVGHA